MENENSIRNYCTLEHYCFPCFKEDQQDPVKLYNGFCHICDKDKWNLTKASISIDDLKNHITLAPPGWVELYEEELRRR
jgi:hypothetical protein